MDGEESNLRLLAELREKKGRIVEEKTLNPRLFAELKNRGRRKNLT